jgi:acyl carrier protein
MDDAFIKSKIKKFLSESLIKEPTGSPLKDDDSFFEKEVIDSTGVLELVLFIEQTFGFAVEDEEIVPENLDSINQLIAYVRSKLTKSSAAS